MNTETTPIDVGWSGAPGVATRMTPSPAARIARTSAVRKRWKLVARSIAATSCSRPKAASSELIRASSDPRRAVPAAAAARKNRSAAGSEREERPLSGAACAHRADGPDARAAVMGIRDDVWGTKDKPLHLN